jgi:hypothetical protein
LQRHDLCLMLLPELIRQKVFGYIREYREDISNRGYTGTECFVSLEKKVGPMRSDTEVRKIITHLTLTSNLDG